MPRPDPQLFAAARCRFEEIADLEPAAQEAAVATLAASDPGLAAAVRELLAADAAAGARYLEDGVGGFAPAR